MNPGRHGAGSARFPARIGVPAVVALAAALYLTTWTGGVGYAGEPTATAPPAATTSAGTTASPSQPSASAGDTSPLTPTATVAAPTRAVPAPTTTAPETGAAPATRHGSTRGQGTQPGATVRPNTLAVAASPYLVLSATGLDAVGLSYVGTVTVPTSSGTVDVLRFTMTSGTLAGMTLVQACAGGVRNDTTAASASLGSTTFDAVSLAATVGGTAVAYSAAAPPATAFPAEVVLQDLTLTATTVSAGTLSMPAFATGAESC